LAIPALRLDLLIGPQSFPEAAGTFGDSFINLCNGVVYMSMKKSFGAIAMASALVLNAGPVLAAHFEVGSPGSQNGNFVITGAVAFMSQAAGGVENVWWPDLQSDVDDPLDNGPPVVTVNDGGGLSTWYTCNATMHGSVVNGIASITSVSLSGTTSVCIKVQGAVNGSLPWQFHALSQPGNYTAVLKGISFYAPALFNCHGASATANIGSGYVEFGDIPGAGCNFSSWGNAAVVSPPLNLVYP
jgi:hypothetical protein